jgi:hypothetical protein
MMAAPKGHPNYDTEGLAGRPVELDERFGDALADEFINWWFENPDCCWFYQFFDDVKRIHRQTLAEVSGRSKKLKDALKMISKSQEGRIFQGGMKGIYKENTVGRALTCKYKWQPPPQKSQVTVKNSNIKSMMDFADGESADMMKPD